MSRRLRSSATGVPSGRWTLGVLGLLLFGASAGAVDTSGALPDVEVRAPQKALAQQADRFVTDLLAQQRSEDSVSRWTTPVCPLVAGLPRAPAETLLRELTRVWQAVGVPLAGDHCEANLYLIATTDPAEFLKKWQRHDRRLYGRASPQAIHRFETDPTPIRIWRNVTQDSPGAAVSAADVPAAGIGQQFAGARATRSYSASRLVYTEVRVFASTIAVMDLRRLEGVPFETLAAYLAFVTAAEIEPVARVDAPPTILSLVGSDGINPQAPSTMTGWDTAFLRGLYATDARVTTQRAMITEHMTRELSGATLKP